MTTAAAQPSLLHPNAIQRPSTPGESAASNPPAPSRTFSHGHSHSHSGFSTNLSPSPTPSANNISASAKLRASVDAGRSTNNAVPPIPRSNSLRPSSELLSAGLGAMPTPSPDNEAIDKWFADLQNYEATLEEMAAASLDANFKEELGAIEQWFRVLSEAERTAALYSLLQSSTQVQIRFFITVLQQMSRSDPNAVLLSPANPMQTSMEQQMMASMRNYKSPAASPVVRNFARQSIGAMPDSSAYLSPSSAMFNNSSTDDDAAAALQAQRDRLAARAAHRISAPGSLLSAANSGALDSLKSPIWNSSSNDQPAEPTRSTSPAPGSNRPTRSQTPTPAEQESQGDTLTNNLPQPNIPQSAGLSAMRSPGIGLPANFEDLSPMGNWASMTNTPMLPHFNNINVDPSGVLAGLTTSPNLSQASNKLNGWQKQQGPPGGIVLDDARKFRRNVRVASGGLPGLGRPSEGLPGGVMSGMFDPKRAVSSPQFGQAGMFNQNGVNNNLLNPQAAALSAQQNWRNRSPGFAGTPESGASNGNELSAAQLAAVNAANMANLNLLGLQQQMLLNAANAAGMNVNQMMMNPMMSPVMGMMQPTSAGAPRRSPRNDNRSPNNKSTSANTGAGSGSNPDEAVDVNLLSDTAAWLRALRLHKYTSNFEHCGWQEMIQMDDGDLEAKGVAALGARRKLLKVFENVRIKMDMKKPGDGENRNLGVDSDRERSVSPGLE